MEKSAKNAPIKIQVEIKPIEKNKVEKCLVKSHFENEKSAKVIKYKKSQLQELIKERAQILKAKMDKTSKTTANNALAISLRKKFEEIANKCKNKTERYLRASKLVPPKMIPLEKNQIKANEKN